MMPGPAGRAKPFGWVPAIPGALFLLLFPALAVWFAAPFPPLWVHLLLAVGLLPLIVGAMMFFSAPLTRSGPPTGVAVLLPFAALGVGGAAVWGVNGHPDSAVLAALGGMAVAAALLGWMTARARRALGGPNPGLRWYQAALLLLFLGLAAILAALLHPEWWPFLREAHMRLNLLGFVGVTALGTLQVLLPTVGRYPDPEAGRRLRLDLKLVVAGTLVLAVTPEGLAWAVWLGRLLWLVPVVRLAVAVARHPRAVRQAGGGFAALLVALAGLAGVVLTAVPVSLPLFFAAFLLPLVTAALGHLLPLWWWPTAAVARRERAQARMGRGGLWRGLLFSGSGVAMHAGLAPGAWLAAALLAAFAGQVLWAGLRGRRDG